MLSAVTAIMTLLGSSTVGSLLGGVFAFLNRKVDMQAKQMDLAHERMKWQHDLAVKDKDLEYARVEAEGKRQVAIVEGDAAFDVARANAIAATSKADEIGADEIAAAGKAGWVLVLASAYRKSMRSILTTVVGGAACAINLALCWAFLDRWPALSPAQQVDMVTQALAWISAQASMMFGYWFVSRGSADGRAK